MLTAMQTAAPSRAEEDHTLLGPTPTFLQPNHRGAVTHSVITVPGTATTMTRTMSTLAETTAGGTTAAM